MMNNRIQAFWREWRALLIFLLLMAVFRSSIADWNNVPTGSMRPTIIEGDVILVNKLAYGLKVPLAHTPVVDWDGPRRGDVVVFFSPADGQRLVKRVAGLPGDTLWLRGNRLFVNGEPLAIHDVRRGEDGVLATEELGSHAHTIAVLGDRTRMSDFGPVQVPKGHYFMLGDNRDHSADSRVFGFVPRDAIVGRAFRVAVSLDPDHSYRPRLDRVLEPLP